MKLLNASMKVAAGLALALSAQSALALDINESFEGHWFEPGVSASRGWNIDYIRRSPERGTVFAIGFVYDSQGNPFWVVGADDNVAPGDTTITMTLELIEGGEFGPGVGNPTTVDANWGTMTMRFDSCNKANIAWTSPNVEDGNIDVAPLQNVIPNNPVASNRCVYQKEFTGCPSFATAAAQPRTCLLSGTYTQDIHLTNDTLWVLNGYVFIGDQDATNNSNRLTIEPGTRIIGSGGVDVLTISRGAKIIADGAPHAPIVMTGPNTASNGASSGDWGGLVINGKAPINTCTQGVCTAQGEGSTGTYGGDDEHDSSGILRYVRVQFAGIKFNDEDELNGIAFQGVGDGTVVDHVQVHRNADDGIEFFGGTVNANNLVLSDIEDDSLDWTQGWNGSAQYILVKQIDDPEVDTDHGIEADNLKDNNDNTPRSQPKLANMTLLGKAGEKGALLRHGTGANITNSIITGFSTCLDIDHDATFTAAGTPGNLSGVLTMENTMINCATSYDEEAGDAFTVQSWFEGQSGNSVGDPMLNGFLPPEGASYTSGVIMDADVFGDYFDNVDYMGAFKDADSNWTDNWTEFLDD